MRADKTVCTRAAAHVPHVHSITQGMGDPAAAEPPPPPHMMPTSGQPMMPGPPPVYGGPGMPMPPGAPPPHSAGGPPHMMPMRPHMPPPHMVGPFGASGPPHPHGGNGPPPHAAPMVCGGMVVVEDTRLYVKYIMHIPNHDHHREHTTHHPMGHHSPCPPMRQGPPMVPHQAWLPTWACHTPLVPPNHAAHH